VPEYRNMSLIFQDMEIPEGAKTLEAERILTNFATAGFYHGGKAAPLTAKIQWKFRFVTD